MRAINNLATAQVRNNTPSLIDAQPGPEKTQTSALLSLSLQLSSSHAPWALKVLRQFSTWRQSVHKMFIACCCAHCSCFAHCCHDPFIVRSASNSSTVPWFHSVCASVSMFAITDNCLFLFLFLFLSLFLFLDRYLNTTSASVQPSIPLHRHRSKLLHVHTNSVYVRHHVCISAKA